MQGLHHFECADTADQPNVLAKGRDWSLFAGDPNTSRQFSGHLSTVELDNNGPILHTMQRH
jgi:hypothetical protein